MRLARKLPIILALGVLIALSGCSSIGNHDNAADANANNNGDYIQVGNVTYQLQVSRALNQYEVEDHQYLTGLPAGTTTPASDQFWYGVFLWAQNRTNHPQMTTDQFDIVDTQGNKYYPIAIDTSANPYAWTARQLEPQETEPAEGTTASEGPTGGGLILFKLSTAVYANRPLTLQIYAPGASKVSTISLDL